jgi:hypothetical protein
VDLKLATVPFVTIQSTVVHTSPDAQFRILLPNKQPSHVGTHQALLNFYFRHSTGSIQGIAQGIETCDCESTLKTGLDLWQS